MVRHLVRVKRVMSVETGTNAPATESVDGHGLHYPDLKIEGFRGIKSLHIPRLGRVNLITGKNNTGKSTILEALRLHAYSGANHIISDILSFREEYTRDMERRGFSTDLGDPVPVSALFHGFPLFPEDFGSIAIVTSGSKRPQELGLRIGWFVGEEGEDGIRRLVEQETAQNAESDIFLALVIKTEVWQRTTRLDRLRRGTPSLVRSPTGSRMSCTFVSPYSAETTDNLGVLWDDVALTEDEDRIVEALRIVEPQVAAVSMLGSEESPRTRRAMVRLGSMPRPVPLRSLGDGANRLLAISLSLVNAKGGILLIDEFENGLHYSAQADVWRMVFQLADALDVQVFATTHSWDAVEGFQQAATESPQQGMLLRLVRWRGKLYVTSADEDDLEIITRDNIEVR